MEGVVGVGCNDGGVVDAHGAFGGEDVLRGNNMGDRFTLFNFPCPYCKKENEEVYYAESCGITEYTCDYCKKTFDIRMDFTAVPRTENSFRERFRFQEPTGDG